MPVGNTDVDGETKKKWAIVIVCLVAVVAGMLSLASVLRSRSTAAAPAVRGGGYPGGRQMPGTRGQITAVSGSAITIQTREGGAKTYTLTAATQITVDRNTVAATQLQIGQRARVISTDDKSAAEVHVRTRPPGGRGRRGGTPGGLPAAVGVS